MANANNFQASRPNVVYPQVTHLPRTTNNVNILGSVNDAATAWSTIEKALGKDPASMYNKAIAEQAKSTTYKNLVDQIASADPDQREAMRASVEAAFPQYKESLDALDLPNMKAGDFARSASKEELMRLKGGSEGYQDRAQQGQPAPVDASSTGLTGDMVSDAGGYVQTEGGGMPAQQPMEQQQPAEAPAQPTPFDSELAGEPGNPMDSPPPEVSPAVAAIEEASRVTGMPVDDFYSSPHTGEPKLKFETVAKYPQMPPSAFMDVLLAGPEDGPIRDITALHAPDLITSRNDLIRSGAALRVYRAYELGTEVSMDDVMLMSLENAGVDMYRAELRAKVGGGLDPSLINMNVADSVSKWMRPDIDPAIRTDPSVVADMATYAALPPTAQKVVFEIAKAQADREINWKAHREDLDYKNAALGIDTYKAQTDRFKAQEQAINDRDRNTNFAERTRVISFADGNTSWMDDTQRAAWYTSKMDERKAKIRKDIAAANLSTLKTKYAPSEAMSKSYDLLSKLAGLNVTKQKALVDGFADQMKQTQNDVSKLESERKDLIKALPLPLQNFIENSITPTDPELVKQMKDVSKGSNVISRINSINTQLNGVDGNSGLRAELVKIKADHRSEVEKLRKQFLQEPESRRLEILSGLMSINPEAADQAQKAQIIAHSGPNAKVTEAFFNALDYNFPDGLNTMRQVYIKREQGEGNKPGKPVLDANGNTIYQEPTADQLISAIQNQAKKGKLQGVADFNLGNISPEQLRKAVTDWMNWEKQKEAARGYRP